MNVVELFFPRDRETAHGTPSGELFRRLDRVALELLGDADESGSPSSLSYRDLDRLSATLETTLVDSGVKPGDRVVVQVDKSLAAVVIYLAVLRSGAVFVPLNVAYTPDEVAFFLEDSAPVLVVGSAGTITGLKVALEQWSSDIPRLALLTADARAADTDLQPDIVLQPFAGTAPATSSSTKEIFRAASDGAVTQCRDHDLAAILYTSGTTGRSKGAMLTHGNLRSNARALMDIWEFEDSDVLLHVLPIFHVHGLFVALNVAFGAGASVLFAESFHARQTVDALERSTVFMGVPTHYGRLLQEPGLNQRSCSMMRLFTSGSAPLDPVRFVDFERRTGHRILERYGMTEAGMITSNPYRESASEQIQVEGGSVGEGGVRPTELGDKQVPPAETQGFPTGPRVAGTVGYPLPGVEVEIGDQSGGVVASGVIGILRVRGPNVFAGYWQLPEKTTEALTEDGWLTSGDQAKQDESGRVTLVGRVSDMIIVGGYNVYPREIEDCLLEVPGVAEVAVVGVPHGDMGEGVIACLVGVANESAEKAEPAPAETRTAETRTAGTRTAEISSLEAALDSLAKFKRPRRMVWLDQLPRNAMGKVQKAELRRRYADIFAPIE